MMRALFTPKRAASESGFTLIELSIVLVIIGLIVGGILVGRDLISAAAVRAQISQIEKYSSAVNTFRNKYGGLPGDLQANLATQFGFAARGGFNGQGDGNGIVQGYWNGGVGHVVSMGETAVFWVDLSAAGLIDSSFTTASETVAPASDITGSAVGLYMPTAIIGQGNYVYVWSGGTFYSSYLATGVNYFGIAGVTDIAASSLNGRLSGTLKNITVQQAYNIDKKVDDGFPISGSVTAEYLSLDPVWTDGTDTLVSQPPTQTAAGSTTCFDNNNVSGARQQYSLLNANLLNCALSFRFQ